MTNTADNEGGRPARDYSGLEHAFTSYDSLNRDLSSGLEGVADSKQADEASKNLKGTIFNYSRALGLNLADSADAVDLTSQASRVFLDIQRQIRASQFYDAAKKNLSDLVGWAEEKGQGRFWKDREAIGYLARLVPKGNARKSLVAYQNYVELNELHEKASGNNLTEDERRVVRQYAQEGVESFSESVEKKAEEMEKARQKAEGTNNSRFVDLAKYVARAFANEQVQRDQRDDKMDKYGVLGLAAERGKAHKRYQETGIDYKDALTQGLQKAADHRNPRTFVSAVSYLTRSRDAPEFDN